MQEKFFSKDFIEQVKSKNDIVSLIGKYVRLEKKGRDFWGCCPFHHEKTPSFVVHADEQYYHCFGCGESGKCGEGASCGYCAFLRVMQAAINEKTEKTETVHTTVRRAGHMDKISVRIRIMPLDGKGKLFLGLTDGSYQSEMEREMLSAQQMQRRLLPAGKSMGGVPYSYMYIPCLGVGGDLPDVYELDNQTFGVIADVSGKGIAKRNL